MNCRTHKKRIEIVKQYDVIPIAHLKLLNGKTIPSDAGGIIEDSYFIFNCKSKITNLNETIYCGRAVASDFCNLINEPLPNIFNPLKSEIKPNSQCNTSNNIFSSSNEKQNWSPIRIQLYNAIMLIFYNYNIQLNSTLIDIKKKVELRFIEKDYYMIKSVNTILKKYNTTARKIINDLSKYNDLKTYKFDLLIKELEKENIQQYYEF